MVKRNRPVKKQNFSKKSILQAERLIKKSLIREEKEKRNSVFRILNTNIRYVDDEAATSERILIGDLLGQHVSKIDDMNSLVLIPVINTDRIILDFTEDGKHSFLTNDPLPKDRKLTKIKY